jgi:hypothetical protein
MKHRVSTAAFLCVALLLSATAAWASVPSLANSTVPQGIQLVGSTGGVPDAKGEAVVIVRDAGNNPLPGVTVYIEFSNCMSPPQAGANKDIHLNQVQPWAVTGASSPQMFYQTMIPPTPDTQTPVAFANTDATGTAKFRLLGKACAGPGNPPGITNACAKIWLGTIGVGASVTTYLGAYDLNGVGGVNAADQGIFLGTLFGAYRSRCDYNGSGTVTAADLAKLLAVQFAAGSLNSSGPAGCVPNPGPPAGHD